MIKKSSSEPCCSKEYRKNTESLNNKIEDLKSKLSESDIYGYSYKLGVGQLEGRLAEYKEREVKYIEKIRTLEMDKEYNLRKINKLTNEVEALKEEKDVVDGKLARLLKSSKDLEDIIESQRPSPTVESTSAEGDRLAERPTTNKAEFVKAAERPTTDKVETAKKPAVRYADMYRRASKRSNVRGNQRNWNNLKSYQLGQEFVLHKKPCFNYSDFSHLAIDCRKRIQRETTRSQNHAYKSRSHRTYGAPMRPSHGPASHRPHGLPMRPMKSNMNDTRPRTSAVRPQYRALWVPTVNRNFPPVNRKVPTGNSNVSTVCCCCSRHVNPARPKAVINKRNRVKDVQASACWVWKFVKPNSASIILKRYDYVDVRGRSRSVMAWVPKKG
nr:hypothetical protein [Tanacetum cinerariifolium]